jgi:hypothetical protein
VSPKKNTDGYYVSWTTITYRSVFLSVMVVLLLVGVVSYIAFPEPTRAGMAAVGRMFGALAERLGVGAGNGAARPAGAQTAHFTHLDGTVRVKKSNSNIWALADHNVPLEKGDVVQTGSEGMARVVFADGTHYTIKQDSLIVIEENSTNEERQTQVAVQVTTGTVDLTTATYVQGSSSQVIVAGATASLAPESSAMVRNDPRADQREILVRRGSGEVRRGDEVVQLTDYEKVSFRAESARMNKQREMRPPTLISPANMAPIFVTKESAHVQFSWTPVDDIRGYRVRISRNPYFSSHVADRRVTGTDLRLANLEEGPYYWMVHSIDANGRESIESERNRFTVIPKTDQVVSMLLELDNLVQHGRVIEVRGRTEPGARVMVNGAEVPYVRPDGTFNFFTMPMGQGENLVTVTAQNAMGGVSTQQRRVVIQ